MSSKSTGRGSDAFMLRFPEGMRDRIKEAAAENNRSMNAEIIARLEKSLAPEETLTMAQITELLTVLARTIKPMTFNYQGETLLTPKDKD